MKKFYPFLITLLYINCHQLTAQPGIWKFMGPNRFYFGGGEAIYDITFPDSLTGYASSFTNPRILKSTDGGETWNLMLSKIVGHKMQFPTATVGWMTDGKTISKTMDGGNSWQNQFTVPNPSDYNDYIWDIHFPDINHGYITGQNYLLKTVDGGNTFTSIAPWHLDSSWRTVFFLDDLHGWAFGKDSTLIRTNDGGINWTRHTIQQFGPYYNSIRGAHFYNTQTGIAINQGGKVFRTDDGGGSWTNISNMTSTNLSSIKFGDKGLAYAINYGGSSGPNIQISSDSGKTWTSGSIPDGGLFAGFFSSPNRGFAGQFQIYKTINAGQTWQSDEQQFTTNYYPIDDIDYLAPNRFFGVSNFSFRTFQSLDNGVSWTTNANNMESIYQIQYASSNCAFMQTEQGMKKIENGVQTQLMTDRYFLFAQSCDSVITYQRSFDSLTILRTTDGGNTWVPIFRLRDSRVASGTWEYGDDLYFNIYRSPVRFMNWKTGIVSFYVSAGVTKEYLTLDGGNTWKEFADNAHDGPFTQARVSPTGTLVAVRKSDPYINSFWKLDANQEWNFQSRVSSFILSPIASQRLDFDWSPDGLLWTSVNYASGFNSLQYSADEGISWNIIPLNLYSETSLFKKLHDGRLLAGTTQGEILEFNSSAYNCRARGHLFYDFNLNGIKDGYDLDARAYPVRVQPGGTTSYSSSNGQFTMMLDSGNYTLTPDTNSFFLPSPVSRNITFNSQTGISNGNDFAIQPKDTSYRDLLVHLIEGYQSNPGFEHTTYLTIYNLSPAPMEPQLMLILDSVFTYNNATFPHTRQNGDTIFWNLPLMPPFHYGMINVDLTMSVNAQLGDYYTNTAVITPITGDRYPADNMDSSYILITGSYDPNIKVVSPAAALNPNQTTEPKRLNYTIHFQNTGTDTARFVIIKDALDPSLDLSTLHVIAASHPYDYHVETGNVLVFRFLNIMLPDSNASEENSHGFVSFIISLKASRLQKDTLHNTADIYFDYNPPIRTNSAYLTVDHSVYADIRPMKGDMMVNIFPNPASTHFQIETDGPFEAVLYNLMGQKVYSVGSEGTRATVSVVGLSAGIYCLQVVRDGKMQGYLVSVTNQY